MVDCRVLRRLWTATRGNVTVEFALVVPVVLLLLIACIDLGMALTEKARLETAAEAGLSFARHDHTDDSGIRAAVLAATRADPDSLRIATTTFCGCADGGTIDCTALCSGGLSPGTYVRVQVQKTYQGILITDLVQSMFDMEGEAIGRVQ